MFKKYEPNKKKYRILLASQPGQGKSRAALNGCKNTAVLDLDDGLISVDEGADMSVLSLKGPETASKFREAVDYLMELEEPFKMIVVDTLSLYCKALEDALRDAGIDKSEFWQVWSSKITKTFNDLNSIDSHIVYITHEKWTDDDGKILLTPDITGQKFNSYARSKMDMIAYFGHAPEEEEGLLGQWDNVSKAATKNRMYKKLVNYKGFGTGEDMFENVTEMINFLEKD